MRLVYTADLHGDIQAYRALLELAVAYGARATIVGGDLLPHAIKLASAVAVQRDFIAGQLRPLLARFHADHPAIGVYLLPGNDDWAAAIAALDDLEREALAFPLHERVYALTDSPAQGEGASAEPLYIAGYGCVPPTPFSIKDYERIDTVAGAGHASSQPAPDFGMGYISWEGAIRPLEPGELATRPSIAEGLASLERLSDPRRTIYVCHTPPAGTPLDQMPRDRHVGSRALRAFVEHAAPPLTLHGHIHEAPHLSGQFATRLGTTWCVNPGNDQRRFHAVSLDTADIEGTIEHTVFGRPAW